MTDATLDLLQAGLVRKFGLILSGPEDLVIERRKRGKGFSYHRGGKLLDNAADIERIRQLAIPPAWTDVRIAPLAEHHLQALGRSPTDRTQYLYHAQWAEIREAIKLERLKRFGRALPAIRRQVRRDLGRNDLTTEFMCAAATALIDRTQIRVGSWSHTELTGTRGATTLLRSDVETDARRQVHLHFTGKGGKEADCTVDDRRLARILHRLADLPGRYLFDVVDNGERLRLTAGMLNDYLQQAGGEPVTAKDFRSFDASAQAVAALSGRPVPDSQRGRQRIIMEIARQAAERLGNTPTMARNSYIHRRIIEVWEKGKLPANLARGPQRAELSREETALARFLDSFG